MGRDRFVEFDLLLSCLALSEMLMLLDTRKSESLGILGISVL